MKKAINLARHCSTLIKQHGSTRAAGEALGIEFAYLHRMASGKQDNPSDETLAKLGLMKVVKFYSANNEIA